MSQNGRLPNGHFKATNGASEQTRLLPPGPTTVDASNEALLNSNRNALDSDIDKSGDESDSTETAFDDGHTTANQTITPIRGTLVIIALGCLIFLQGW